jgi:hypothetical protein
MKFNLAQIEFNLAQIKFTSARMKFNLAQLKFTTARIKFDLAQITTLRAPLSLRALATNSKIANKNNVEQPQLARRRQNTQNRPQWSTLANYRFVVGAPPRARTRRRLPQVSFEINRAHRALLRMFPPTKKKIAGKRLM